jgi:hypothetical protein
VNVRRSFVRLTALTVVAAVPIMGMAGVASAKTTKAAQCGKHSKHGKCQGGSAGAAPQITVSVAPNGTNNPLFEVGQSEIYAVVQVETQPAFAGDEVNISSSQFKSSCDNLNFDSIASGTDQNLGSTATVTLDNEGNATVVLNGTDCAPGLDLLEADLNTVPFYTATTWVTVNPPTVTPPGVFGEPQINGQAAEVETGDTQASGDSDIYAVFFVEENPVYAEQTVEIGSTQLEDRCQTGWTWIPSSANVPKAPGTVGYSGVITGPAPGGTPSTVLDDDGNAAFVFKGTSCAAGPSTVVADVLAGTHDTFTTTFTVLPPAVTI